MSIQKILKGLAAVSLMLMTTIADAAPPTKGTITTAPTVTGNAQGRLLASNCFQCHGTYGSGGFYPLFGKGNVSSTLTKYLSGSSDSIMAAHLKGYTPEQLQAIADYFANP
ncbi:cytochrome c [Methylobacter sp. BlB1]|uniref:c-type cytochrome n=1 Tax=Methylobacter sp. BlB1 TaxID=2785914 RepID=UPI001895B462|nr:cytochrome c [Methylobacter sp. BlB1]MBF6649804.1 cytochrome c [Methylobacter sp. BlB1]